MALNACELEIDLFCRGLIVPPAVSLAGARGVSRRPAGLGSGLELAIPAPLAKREIWVNAPVAEPFVRASPYRLLGGPGGYAIVDDRDRSQYEARLPPQPSWYEGETSNDVPMNRIGVLQGTCLAIYVHQGCAYWNESPPQNCRFCTPGQTAGVA